MKNFELFLEPKSLKILNIILKEKTETIIEKFDELTS
jgi:hypothetical protein